MHRATKLILILFALLLSAAFNQQARANTVTALTCKVSDVQAAINSAKNGDTVTIPGSCTWTTGITIPSAIGITITGTGTPDSNGSTQGASASCSSTVITLSGATAFKASLSFGASTTRLSCMALNYGGGASVAFSILGSCTASGCNNLRVDNITFNNWAGHASAGISYGISAVDNVFGVLDHNTINGVANNYLQLVEFSLSSYQGVGMWGDNSWHQPEGYGTSHFLFIENNIFNTAGCCENEGNVGGLQNMGGGFVVVRFNQFNNMDTFNFSMGWHGTESAGRPRSTRAFEYYQNTWSCASGSACGQVAGARGGTGLFWGNDIHLPGGAAVNSFFTLSTFRSNGSIGGWGACDGSAPYDANDGVTYFSGTIGSIAGNVITVGGNSPGWTANKWFVNGAPYSMHDTTANSGTEITANGPNTLTLLIGGGPGAYTPAVGHSIQILRATACIDQAGGRGAGVLYDSTLNPAASIPTNEILSPTRAWLNTADKLPAFSSSQITTGGVSNRQIALRDFYMERMNQPAQSSPTAPFDGTITTACTGGLGAAVPCGVGHGTLANRPATCTMNTSYWATDQGNWNQSGSGEQGELFVCTATNTWTLYYTPYTYPHPLVAGGTTGTGGAPDPPTAVRVVVQ
jgi:hypothetical protein